MTQDFFKIVITPSLNLSMLINATQPAIGYSVGRKIDESPRKLSDSQKLQIALEQLFEGSTEDLMMFGGLGLVDAFNMAEVWNPAACLTSCQVITQFHQAHMMLMVGSLAQWSRAVSLGEHYFWSLVKGEFKANNFEI